MTSQNADAAALSDASLELDGRSLDPADWAGLREEAHRMLDDALDDLSGLREQPVWSKMPPARRQALREPLPEQPQGLSAVYDAYRDLIQPYATGNRHPGFFGWVHGGGTVIGMLAEMLAGSLNANLGGRDHAPIEVERQVIRWAAEMLGFPAAASGLLVTGTSMANMIGVLIARTQCLGPGVRRQGVGAAKLIAYTSAAAHTCIARAMDMAGIGTDSLHLIPCDAAGRMDLTALATARAQDVTAGLQPFLVVGTAGSVDIGAVDDLTALADFCAEYGLWFHVDGAFGAMARLSRTRRSMLAGIERADSVGFDFHKWAQVPYDAGCIVVRDPLIHRAAFASTADYLRRDVRGLAGGAPWPCDLGPDLSRGFRALKVWMTIKTYGSERLGAVVDHSCELAQYLAEKVTAHPDLEILAPVALNIVCFRVVGRHVSLDVLNAEIVADLQEAGIAAPSTTKLDGVLAIRVAIVNHRTTRLEIDRLLDAVLGAASRYGAI